MTEAGEIKGAGDIEIKVAIKGFSRGFEWVIGIGAAGVIDQYADFTECLDAVVD